MGHYESEATEEADSRNRCASDIDIFRYSLWSNYTYYVERSKRHAWKYPYGTDIYKIWKQWVGVHLPIADDVVSDQFSHWK